MADKHQLYFYQATPSPNLSGEPTFVAPWEPTNRQLIDDLQTYFATVPSVQRAYFVRLEAPWPEVGLGLASAGLEEPEIVNRSTFIWNWHLGRSAPLLVFAVPRSLEPRLVAVCHPFYAAA